MSDQVIAKRKTTKYPRFDAVARIDEIMADGKRRSMARIKKDARVVTVVGLKTTIQEISAADVGDWFLLRLKDDRATFQQNGNYGYYKLLTGPKDDFDGQNDAADGQGDLEANP